MTPWQPIETAPKDRAILAWQPRTELFEDYFLGPFMAQVEWAGDAWQPCHVGGWECETEWDGAKFTLWTELPREPEDA